MRNSRFKKISKYIYMYIAKNILLKRNQLFNIEQNNHNSWNRGLIFSLLSCSCCPWCALLINAGFLPLCKSCLNSGIYYHFPLLSWSCNRLLTFCNRLRLVLRGQFLSSYLLSASLNCFPGSNKFCSHTMAYQNSVFGFL